MDGCLAVVREVASLAVAENIAPLSLLTHIPAALVQNPAVDDLVCNGQRGRSLTFERQRDIVNNLAFLSAALDNAEKVTAVYVQKHTNTSGVGL